jgi:hypothetical protein
MRAHLRFAAVVAAVTLGLVAAAPAIAAAPVSQSGANAITVKLAGNGQGTGNTTATNDGSTEKKTGDATPPISVLQGQSLFQGGALAQEATAGADGHSAACAGLAGNGGSVVNIGGSSCLDPGDEVHATLSSLDLSHLVVADPASALAPLNTALTTALGSLAPLTSAINQGLTAAQAQVGDLGLVAGFGAIEGRCTASPDSADGTAHLVDAHVTLQAPGQDVNLLDLPVDPPPNTHLTTNLSAVLDSVLDAVDTDLDNSLDGNASALTALTSQLRTQVVAQIHDQVESNLAPLEQNVLDVVLNKQTRTSGAIKVNAIDMQILPAAEAQVGASAGEIQIGNVACGPNGRVVQAAEVSAPTTSHLPKAVSAGLATVPADQRQDDSHDGIALAALAIMLLGGTALVLIGQARA